MNGICKAYYENGQLKSEALYYNDKLMNSSRYYYKNGEHISKRK
jgi:antitoxin component YwqK of YwqJK toxin-antitoxin module